MGAIPRTRSASVRDGRQCLFLAKRFNIAHSESRKMGVDVGKRRFNGVLSRGGRSFEVEETSKSRKPRPKYNLSQFRGPEEPELVDNTST